MLEKRWILLYLPRVDAGRMLPALATQCANCREVTV